MQALLQFVFPTPSGRVYMRYVHMYMLTIWWNYINRKLTFTSILDVACNTSKSVMYQTFNAVISFVS